MSISENKGDDLFYRTFEEKFRGSRALIKTRLEVYRPFVNSLLFVYPDAQAIDLGCGRGEWLELLAEWGFESLGVDQDAGMLAACQELGLMVKQSDAIAHLRSLPAESLALVSAFHLAEHLQFDDLRALVTEAWRVLRSGGLLIMETPNPENLVVATRNFYLDPTHQRPIPAQLLSFVAEYAGFARVKTLGLQEPKDLALKTEVTLNDVFGGVSPDYAVIAQKQAPGIVLARFESAFGQEYGLGQEELLARWDTTNSDLRVQAQQAETTAHQAEAKAQQAETTAHQAEAKAQQAETTAHQAEAKAQQAETTAHQAETKSQALAAELHAVLTSPSWRVTTPLRWLERTVSRYKRSCKKRANVNYWKGRLASLKRSVKKRLGTSYREDRILSNGALRSEASSGRNLTLGVSSDASTEVTQLTPRARQIYIGIKAAIERSQMEAS